MANLYTISSVSRGKELKVILTPLSGRHKAAHIVFRFGMSGSFTMTNEDEIHKHAHLRFYSKDVPRQVLCFVDPRRFGTWHFNGPWQPERGPCVMQEYEKFRENVLKNLSDKTFDKPICEALLNQKYFNGIGNYLRSEILFRLNIPPFMAARSVLETIKHEDQNDDIPLRKKVKLKDETPDLLQLCHLVPREVVDLGGKGYAPGQSNDYSILMNWARCYFVPGMKSLKDRNGRTVWFDGDPGPLAPKGTKAGKRKKPAKVARTATKRRVVVKEEVEEQQVLQNTGKKRGRKLGDRKDKEEIKKTKLQRKPKTSQSAKKNNFGRRLKAPPQSQKVTSALQVVVELQFNIQLTDRYQRRLQTAFEIFVIQQVKKKLSKATGASPPELTDLLDIEKQLQAMEPETTHFHHLPNKVWISWLADVAMSGEVVNPDLRIEPKIGVEIKFSSTSFVGRDRIPKELKRQ
ncbi:endonuclease 8-like 1 [Pelodytes ibericus]